MSMIATALLAGASLGLTIAAPIGPKSLLCIQRTLVGGLPVGLATGLGVATVHLTYGTLVARWGSDFAAAWSNAALLSVVSGLLLLALAVRVLRGVLTLHATGERRRTLVASYGTAVCLALANPITPVLFLAAMPTLLAHASAPLPVLAAGVFLGSLGWWVALNTAVSLFRGWVTARVLNRLNKAAGLLLAALAVSLLAKGLAPGLSGMPAIGIGAGPEQRFAPLGAAELAASLSRPSPDDATGTAPPPVDEAR